MAVAASGAMQYEGIAGNDAHRDWLDSIVDGCVMCKAGHEEGYAEQLGGDAEFAEKASKYFGGAMMEARRLLMPDDGEGGEVERGSARGGSWHCPWRQVRILTRAAWESTRVQRESSRAREVARGLAPGVAFQADIFVE